MQMPRLKEFLDSHKVKYRVTSYSPAHTSQELETNYKDMLGMELVEAVFLEIDIDKIVIAVLPASLTIDIEFLRQYLGTQQVRLLSSSEVEKLFPDCKLGTVIPMKDIYGVDVLLAKDLEDNREIQFYVDSYRDLLAMDYADFRRLANANEEIRIPTKSRYRAWVKKVSPHTARQNIENYNSCFLGISLQNPSFSTAKLVAITDWIANRFQKCIVVIGDSLHRITLQIDRKLNEKQAFSQAIFMGKEYINTEMTVFRRHADTCHFEFIYCSEVQQLKDYKQYYEELQDLFAKNEKFANSVKSFSMEFVNRHMHLCEHDKSYDFYEEICREYLLEELAIFSCLFKDQIYPIFYPGSLSIFGEIAEGVHPDIPACLKNIIYASLRLMRR